MLKRNLCLVAALTMALAVPAVACKLPVFRYALERWAVDRYRMIAIVQQADDPLAQEAITKLQSLDLDDLNLDLEIVEVAKLSEAELWQVEGIEDGVTSNRLLVYYPSRNGSSRECWDGNLTTENIDAWLDSPVRRELADDIVSGALGCLDPG